MNNIKKEGTVSKIVQAEGDCGKSETKITSVQAWWLFSSTLQDGIYQMPYVLFVGGHLALICHPVIACSFWYSGIILVDSMYDGKDLHGNRRRVRHTYGEITRDAFQSKIVSQLVTLLIIILYFMSSLLLLVACSNLLLHSFPEVTSSLRTWTLLCSLCIIPLIICIDSLKSFAKLGTVQLFLRNLILIFVLCSCIFTHKTWNLSAIGLHSNLQNVIVAIGIVMRSNGIHVILNRTDMNMENPSQLPSTLACSFIVTYIIKMFFGLMGIAAMQDHVTYFITDDFSNRTLKRIGCIISTLIIILSYPYTFNQVMNYGLSKTSIFYGLLKYASMECFEITLKIVCFCLVFITSLIFQNIAVITAINGGITVNILWLIFPCFFHLRLKRNVSKWYINAINILVIILGSVLCCVEIYIVLFNTSGTKAVQ